MICQASFHVFASTRLEAVFFVVAGPTVCRCVKLVDATGRQLTLLTFGLLSLT